MKTETASLLLALAQAESKVAELAHSYEFSTWYSGRASYRRSLRRWERKVNEIRSALGYGLNAPTALSR